MKPNVFIGSSSEALELAELVKSELTEHAEVKIWNDGVFSAGQYFLDSLLEASDRFDYFILLATPDDELKSRSKIYSTPRDNLIFELGLFLGKVRKERVLLVTTGGSSMKLPSDFTGIQTLRVNKSDDGNWSLGSTTEALVETIEKWGSKQRPLEGRRLFAHKGLYPIDLAGPEGRDPMFNAEVFAKALHYFCNDERDELAATDLIYLWHDNLDYISYSLSPAEADLMDEMVQSYNLQSFIEQFNSEHEAIFGNYKRIVRDIGRTLSDVHFEILLHDVRNPLRSIIAAENSKEVSERNVGDPSTRFVVQYVREQGKRLILAMSDGSKIAYRKKFKKDKFVKATTTPIWNTKYGLVGILCFNIDIDAIDGITGRDEVSEEVDFFLKSFTKNSGDTPDFETDMF